MDRFNYEDSQPDCYNNFEDAEMYLPIFGEDSEAESCVQFDDSGNMFVEDSLPCGVVEMDLGFTIEEKSVARQEVCEDSGFTVEEEQVLAKIKGFFARRALAKTKKKDNLDFDITSTVIPATKEDKGLDLIRVPEWSAFREASFGHGELRLVNSTHAFWSWHMNDDVEPVRSGQVWITAYKDSECLAGKQSRLRKITWDLESILRKIWL